jgi:PAS domain S-box-containing protein
MKGVTSEWERGASHESVRRSSPDHPSTFAWCVGDGATRHFGSEAIYVNLHTHTLLSDGVLTPEVLAERLAAAGVRYAALADHDTVEGWPRFRDALDARGVPTLPGIELTTQHEGRLLHLVAYGFDPDHPELTATLASMREHRSVDTHSIAGSLRAANSQAPSADAQATSAAPDGQLEVGAAMAMLHRAGGRAFLAHPLVYERDIGALERLVLGLKEKGLDGLEAVYDEFSLDEREALRTLARKHDLLVSAGTDYHGVNGLGSTALGIEMAHDDWTRFRAAVLDGPGLAGDGSSTGDGAGQTAASADPAGNPGHFSRRPFVLRVVLPAVAAMALFLIAVWGLMLPSFEQTLVERKREVIRELTNSAWSVLAAYEADERAGVLTREEAQAAAAAVVGEMRYGEERLDYFWIQDTEPTMVMHPYRADLDGEDLSGFTDPRGVPIFVEFADVVEAEDEGYVDYVWQWFDDPERLEPKESYVKGFEPWDWVIGTGLYTDDVAAEIERLERDLILVALGISGLIGLLLLLVLQQSFRIERRREEGVDRLRDSNARYHALVEATSEGTLLVIDRRLRYANPTFLGLLGYTSRQLDFLELDDILPRGQGNDELWAALGTASTESAALGLARDGVLTRSDGSTMECLLTLEPVEFGGQAGNILLARDVTASSAAPIDTSALGVSVGLFRAVAARRAVFMDLSPAGHELLSLVNPAEGQQLALADCFADAAEYGRVYRRLLDGSGVRDHILAIDTLGGSRSVMLSAALVRDEEGEPAWIDGLLVDVTAARGEAADREVQQLRASLLFLHETIDGLGHEAIVVSLDTSLADLATQMTERSVTAALVATASGAVIGIVTDHDIRARVVAEGMSVDGPVETVMTAPLIRMPASAPVYEALLRMEQRGVRHLAVEDPAGQIVGVVDKDTLLRSPSYAPLVLLREIARAESPDDVARRCEHLVPVAASLMDSSARPRHVNSALTAAFDAATDRLVEIALRDLGPAPAPFALVAFGSQGRGEVHLTSDQDNGLIYAVPEGASAEESAAWFLRLGAHVSAGLAVAGYPFCRGRVMASDPKWCRSLQDWTATYDEWLRRSEPQDITDLSVVLDFRRVHGDPELVAELRRHVHATLPEQRSVQYLLARNALTFRPPLRLPGNIYLGGAAESSGHIDLKDALQPIVAFARVYAERHRIGATHTLERIVALSDRDLLPAGSREEISDAYDFLMGLRLETQLAAIRAGQEPTSVVELSGLTSIQRELLRQSFAAIANVQKTAEREFPEAG